MSREEVLHGIGQWFDHLYQVRYSYPPYRRKGSWDEHVETLCDSTNDFLSAYGLKIDWDEKRMRYILL